MPIARSPLGAEPGGCSCSGWEAGSTLGRASPTGYPSACRKTSCTWIEKMTLFSTPVAKGRSSHGAMTADDNVPRSCRIVERTNLA